jgi:hypothetical protein
MFLKTLLLFHLTAESIPESIRNRLSPEVTISTNDNTPDRPFFQPPSIAEVFICSHGNIFPFAHMLNLDLFNLFIKIINSLNSASPILQPYPCMAAIASGAAISNPLEPCSV